VKCGERATLAFPTRAFRAGVPRGRPARQPVLGPESDRLGLGPLGGELEFDLRTGWRILTNSPVLSVPVLLQTDMKPWRREEREGERESTSPVCNPRALEQTRRAVRIEKSYRREEQEEARKY